MVTVFFPNMMLKKYWYFMRASFVARFGNPIMTPNLLHFELKLIFRRLLEDVGTRVVKGFEQPLTIKKQNTQLNQ